MFPSLPSEDQYSVFVDAFQSVLVQQITPEMLKANNYFQKTDHNAERLAKIYLNIFDDTAAKGKKLAFRSYVIFGDMGDLVVVKDLSDIPNTEAKRLDQTLQTFIYASPDSDELIVYMLPAEYSGKELNAEDYNPAMYMFYSEVFLRNIREYSKTSRKGGIPKDERAYKVIFQTIDIQTGQRVRRSLAEVMEMPH